MRREVTKLVIYAGFASTSVTSTASTSRKASRRQSRYSTSAAKSRRPTSPPRRGRPTIARCQPCRPWRSRRLIGGSRARPNVRALRPKPESAERTGSNSGSKLSGKARRPSRSSSQTRSSLRTPQSSTHPLLLQSAAVRCPLSASYGAAPLGGPESTFRTLRGDADSASGAQGERICRALRPHGPSRVPRLAIDPRTAPARPGLTRLRRHYNSERPHRALGRRPPAPPQPTRPPPSGAAVKRSDRLGGLVHEYYWAAA